MKFFFLTLLLSFSTWAQNSTLRTYHVMAPEQKTMDKIADQFEVTQKLNNGFEILVPESKLKSFLSLAPKALLVSNTSLKSINRPDGYRNILSVNAELKTLAAKYPNIAKLETYGTTKNGQVLYVLKISDNVMVDEDEPELMITSATHGDEIITVEVEMSIVNTLLENYNKDPRLTKMITERELFFIPVVNPEGYSKQERYTQDIDPNRDYPYPGHVDKKSVDCIESIRNWFHSRQIKGSIDLHASGKLIMFPWAYTKLSPPKEDLMNFEYLTKSMAEINKYTPGQISKIIYVAKGSSADYYYWKNKTFALGIEMSTSKAPPFEYVSKVIEEAREMIWRFIEHF